MKGLVGVVGPEDKVREFLARSYEKAHELGLAVIVSFETEDEVKAFNKAIDLDEITDDVFKKIEKMIDGGEIFKDWGKVKKRV